MTHTAEQIVKGLMHKGIRITVNQDGNLSLRGNLSGLTDEHRHELRRHKPDIVHYLTENPITESVMYVSEDLQNWVTHEPHLWPDRVTIVKREYVRLAPSVILWFKTRVFKAEAACNGGKLSLEAFTRIIQAFCPVYEFAIRVGMIADPVTGRQRGEGAQ